MTNSKDAQKKVDIFSEYVASFIKKWYKINRIRKFNTAFNVTC
jgi:hypothetical protein